MPSGQDGMPAAADHMSVAAVAVRGLVSGGGGDVIGCLGDDRPAMGCRDVDGHWESRVAAAAYS